MRLNAKVPLLTTLPTMLPVLVLLPSCSAAPLWIVVTPGIAVVGGENRRAARMSTLPVPEILPPKT